MKLKSIARKRNVIENIMQKLIILKFVAYKRCIKTLLSSGFNDYIDTRKENSLEKQQWRKLNKMGKDKIALKKGSCSVAFWFVEPFLSYKIIYE